MKRSRLSKKVPNWLVFTSGGKRLASVSVDGYMQGEIKATKDLLVFEKNIPASKIKVHGE